MKMSTFQKLAPTIVRSGINAMLLSAPGIGKTTFTKSFARTNGLGYVELVLSQIESPDVRGIMVPHRKADGGTPDTVSTRSPLAAMVEAEIEAGAQGGIIFFDEYYQASHDVRKAVSQFLVTKKIGDWSLPEGWVVWGASNPPDWRAGTVAAMGHEKSRWVEINIEPDADGWMQWAADNNVHHLYRAFAHRIPHEVFSTTPPKDKNAAHCNPRSLMEAHKFHALLAGGSNNLPTDEATRQIVAGAIGQGASAALWGFLKVQDVMTDPEAMLADPKGCKLPPADRIDALFACMMQATSYASPETNERLFDFVLRLPEDMVITSIMHFVANDPQALNAPNIAKFCAEHPEAMMALATAA